MSNLVGLQGVSKSYRRGSETIPALRSVTLSVSEGEFVAVVGPSGSGKSTLLHLVGCMDRPDDGSVWIDGRDTTRLAERDLTAIRGEKVGFVFQQFFLMPTLSAAENVELPTLFVRNRGGANRVRPLLARVNMEHRTRHYPTQLSGGEMQRIAIARALINEPRILLADEPTGSLDSTNAEAIFDLFRRLNAEGLTILLVTHNLELASKARRVVRLRDGRIIGDSSTGGAETA